MNIYATNDHNLTELNETYPDGKTKRLDVCTLSGRVDVIKVDDLLEMLDTDGVKNPEAMMFQQGWYIARYIRNQLNTNNPTNKNEVSKSD